MRFVMTTLGSLGDLHPYLAIGAELRERGHEVTVASAPSYRERVEKAGLKHACLGPDLPTGDEAAELYEKAMDTRKGTEFIIRQWAIPRMPEMLEQTRVLAEGCDAFVGHVMALATPVIAEQRGVPWASIAIAPVALFSAFDPPALPAPWPFPLLLKAGPTAARFTRWVADQVTRRWLRDYYRIRREHGLSTNFANPFLAGQHSPSLVLATFSRVLATPQPDWPAHTVQTGFPFHDETHHGPLPDRIETFLNAGERPIIFTLGSAAVHAAGNFYETSSEVARRLKKRAIFLVGPHAHNVPRDTDPDHLVVDYAPFASLLPRGLLTVHQGGIGTTGQALRAGRPMLVVPWSHDQPDNGLRVQRAGVGRMLPRKHYTVERATAILRSILDDPNVLPRAEAVRQTILSEGGAPAAAETLITWAASACR